MSGPETGGPPSGPGRDFPLTAVQRLDNYRRQTGRAVPTARQMRRLAHKANRAEARMAH